MVAAECLQPSADQVVALRLVLKDHSNGDDRKLKPAIAAFAVEHGWQDLLCLDDDRLFHERRMALLGWFCSLDYAEHRFHQLRSASFRYWVYRHGNSLNPRKEHVAWDGLILPPDHPFWNSHFPPNSLGCGCYVIGARSMESAVRRGGRLEVCLPDGWDIPSADTGQLPGIDRGYEQAVCPDFEVSLAEILRHWH